MVPDRTRRPWAVALVLLLVVLTVPRLGGAQSTPAGGDPCAARSRAATPAGRHGHGATTGTPMAGREEMLPAATPAGAGVEFDLVFIDLMIPHHEAAVAMAEVALVHAEHEEIETLAREIIRTQTAEIEQLAAWRAAWYPAAAALPMDRLMEAMGPLELPGAEPMPGMGMVGMTMDPAAEVAALCAAAGPFDLAFIDLMTPHHESAIAMAQSALERASHPELRELAHSIIDAQQREIDQMRAWREAWAGGAATVTAGQAAPAIADAADLAAALRSRGLRVEERGRVRQPFLRAERGIVLRVSGGDLARAAEVQVFSYAESAAARRDAAGIGRDGQPEATRISWVGDPHFYRQGRLILLYVGADRALIDLLTAVLGPPFAGR